MNDQDRTTIGLVELVRSLAGTRATRPSTPGTRSVTLHGTPLPADFLQVVSQLGGFSIGVHCDGDVIRVTAPGEALDRDVEYYLEVVRATALLTPDDGAEPLPFNVFPAPGGLLPFASNVDADIFCWRTQGPPDDWTIVSFNGRDVVPEWYEFDGGFAEWLHACLTRREFPPMAPSSDRALPFHAELG